MSFERYIIRSEMLRGSQEKACKQNIGNFRFSASRASVGMKVISLESYELAVFYGIIASTYDSNDITFIPTLALEAEKRKLPMFCLHAFSRDLLSISERIIHRSKDIFKAITAPLES